MQLSLTKKQMDETRSERVNPEAVQLAELYELYDLKNIATVINNGKITG